MTDSENPHWRFQLVESAGKPVAKPGVESAVERTEWFDLPNVILGTSWLRLLVIHTAFRAAEQTDYQRLLSQLREIERLFIEFPDLEPYYRESFLGDTAASLPEESRARAGHVASLQADLMEDVFYVLQLDRYANAPDNRGWMNLLRRWGRSKSFNARLELLDTTYSEEFLQFYHYYIRDYLATIDESPIPHPWDSKHRRADLRGTGIPETKREFATERDISTAKPLPGIFLDSGIREAASPRMTARSGEEPVEQPGTGQHGTGLGDAQNPSSGSPSDPPTTPPNA